MENTHPDWHSVCKRLGWEDWNMEARHIINFRAGDKVNYIDPNDDAVGTVLEVLCNPPDIPRLRVQYPGHEFTCHAEAFTLVERSQHV